MLYLVGLGIWDEKDISIKGVEVCKKAKDVYMELYTSEWHGSIKAIEGMINKKIKLVARAELEDKMDTIIRKSKDNDIAILVPGDPLVATTHTALYLECMKRGIKVRVINSSSIYTAICRCGLQIYKFGRTVSIPKPAKNFSPLSFYDSILTNRINNMHTLMLLDPEMNVKDALKLLLDAERHKKGGIFSEETFIIVCSRLGSDDEKILYGRIKDVMKQHIRNPAALILPAALHFMEEECLNMIKINKTKSKK
ncbi:MAG TPA: diphthine synthase [Candidatus Aenigmarchaeota archaeon]|nr:MAG: diphthine synthase [Candidatus Aenigmarchaeota archaeon]HDD45983.1 diphthine synthase [Candidatus Aenigmarchaeota archaeon]